MRKKTIEEELAEIAAEKEAHIQKVESRTGHSDDHRYDFSPNEKSSKTSERTYTVHGKKVTKEEYDQWQKDFGKREAKLSEAKSEIAKMMTERNSAKKNTTSDDKFTFDDYCRMIKLEEKDQTDKEFEEYCNLMDRFADAPNKDELEDLYDKLQATIKEDNATIAHFQSGINEVNGIIADCKTRLNKINEISKDINNSRKRDITLGSFIFPIIFLCFFVAAGLGVTFGVGVIPMVQTASYVEVTSIVQNVSTYTDSDGDLHARMYVEYEFEDETYHAYVSKQISRSSVPEIGSQLVIKVNPKKPTQILSAYSDSYIIPIIFGLVFAGIALFMQSVLIAQVVKLKKMKKSKH